MNASATTFVPCFTFERDVLTIELSCGDSIISVSDYSAPSSPRSSVGDSIDCEDVIIFGDFGSQQLKGWLLPEPEREPIDPAVRKLHKTLAQIDALKAQLADGVTLQPNQLAKIAREPELQRELAATTLAAKQHRAIAVLAAHTPAKVANMTKPQSKPKQQSSERRRSAPSGSVRFSLAQLAAPKPPVWKRKSESAAFVLDWKVAAVKAEKQRLAGWQTASRGKQAQVKAKEGLL